MTKSRQCRWSLGLFLAFVAGLSFTVSGADWPNWRGPTKNGISMDTHWSADWPSGGPKVLWQKEIGIGFSSMTVSAGRVYAMGNTGTKGDKNEKSHRDVVYCFDAETGHEIWQHGYATPLDPKYYEGGPSATPTLADGNVFTLGKTGEVYCLDAASGAVRWHASLAQEHGLKVPTWGFSGSALIIDNLVVLNVGTHGLALNKADGALVWSTGTKEAGYSTPVEYEVDGMQCVALFGVDTLAGVAIKTGEVLWEIPWKALHDENIADPVVLGDQMLVSSFLGQRCSLFSIGADKLTEVWQHKDFLTWLNSPVVYQGYAYGADNKGKAFRCMEVNTGKIMWSKKGFGMASVMMAGGKLIILSEKGQLLVVPASPDGFKELASARILKGKCWTVPVLANGRIHARSAAGDLVCLDVSI